MRLKTQVSTTIAVVGGDSEGRADSNLPGLDVTEERSWQNFLETALRLYGTLNRRLSEEHKLALVDVRLLLILGNSDTGSARMGDLAEQLLSLPSRVTRQIRRLEESGLVRREASPEDGRGVLASITEDGRATVAEAMQTYVKGVRQYFVGPLTRPQMVAVGENCRRISAALTDGRRSPKLGRA